MLKSTELSSLSRDKVDEQNRFILYTEGVLSLHPPGSRFLLKVDSSLNWENRTDCDSEFSGLLTGHSRITQSSPPSLEPKVIAVRYET